MKEEFLVSKVYRKKSISFSFAEDVIYELNNYLEKEQLKKSQTIEKIVINFLKEVGAREK
jgi:hypothetical protein